MPYGVKRHSSCPKTKPFGVFKKADGSLVACHANRASANNQRRAIYANEGKSLKELDAMEEQELQAEKEASGETEEKYYDNYYWRPFGGATSFDEIDATNEARDLAAKMEALNYQLRSIVSNVLEDEDVEDKTATLQTAISDYSSRLQQVSAEKKSGPNWLAWLTGESEDRYDLKAPIKRENGIDFSYADYAYVPDKNVASSWRVRIAESPGKVTVASLNKAVTMLPTLVKNKALPVAALAAVKRRIRQEYRKLGVPEAKIPAMLKKEQDSPLFLYKEKDGSYSFVAIYSNNIRDDDYPPEILTQQSHQRFAKCVSEGIVEGQELWHWHIPGTRWGKVKHVLEVDGFAVALGKIDKGHEEEAERIQNLPYPVALSHGMPSRYIVRNKQDPSLIEFYISTEISTLPMSKAANKWTSFTVLQKEQTMPLTADQMTFLGDVGLPKEAIDSLNGLGRLGKAAEEEGRDRKEASEQPETPTQAEKEAVVYVTKEEVAQALGMIMTPVIDALKELAPRIAALEATVKEQQVAKEQAQQQEMTPKASLADLTRQSIFGNQSAQVKQGDPLLQAAPEQNQADQFDTGTGSSFLNGIVGRAYGRS